MSKSPCGVFKMNASILSHPLFSLTFFAFFDSIKRGLRIYILIFQLYGTNWQNKEDRVQMMSSGKGAVNIRSHEGRVESEIVL